METLLMVLVVLLFLASGVVTGLKGKPWLLLIGLLIGWCWIFGALRIAKPQSWWARRFYDRSKLMQARMRFSD
jgi:hypothetical protein